MPKAIVVGYDPHTADSAPVRFGVAIAGLVGASLVVGSVDGGGDAGEAIDDLRGQLQAEGVRAECLLLAGGSTPATLHRAAESWGADLIVLGSTNRGPVRRAVGATTAARTLHGAPCPIAVVPVGWEPGAGLRTIAVASADTPEAEDVRDGGEALARCAAAALRVLQVDTDRSLDAAADALIDASKGVDLLVCGAHGRERWRAVLLASVARRVMGAAHCPVIVVGSDVRQAAGMRLGGTSPTTRVPFPTSER